VELTSSSESEFEDCGAVGAVVGCCARHVVGWAVDDEVAEPGLALVERAVEI
jgi:hypothetical protein